MNKDIIISKYHRNTEWASNLNGNVIIYNKCKDTLRDGEILIDNNVGRCVHTYMYHIVNNYDILNDVSIFCQDNPFDHVSNFIEVSNNISTVNKFLCLTYYLQQSSEIISSIPSQNIKIRDFWYFLFDCEIPVLCDFCVSTHFAVDKLTIHDKSKNFYIKILNILETRYESPWEIERIMPYIFNPLYKERKFKNSDLC